MIEKTLQEIKEIPEKAQICFEKNKGISLPQNADYLGMGASYTPFLALKYAGAHIYPELACEYASYLTDRKKPLAVLVSQSGRSPEVVFCRGLFSKYIAITNEPKSLLAEGKNLEKVILLHAGIETSISSKTYVNILISLYLGLGFDPYPAICEIKEKINEFEKWGEEKAGEIFNFMQNHKHRGFYMIGSGPNLATAYEAALTTSEITKLGIQGMSVAQYDHGPKETASNSIVLNINVKGKSSERTKQVFDKIKNAKDCLVIETPPIDVDENISPIVSIVPLNFLAYFLAKNLGVQKVYEIGDKVIES